MSEAIRGMFAAIVLFILNLIAFVLEASVWLIVAGALYLIYIIITSIF